MPFRSDDGIYEEGFIEERRSALEAFVNKIAGALYNSYIPDSSYGQNLMTCFY